MIEVGAMTKSELIARLAERHPHLVAADAELAVKTILDAMTSSLVEGERIEIRGFGSFSLNFRPPRVGRNPKTGEGPCRRQVRAPLQGGQGIARSGGFPGIKQVRAVN
jgi:integration host factor subunit beta